MSELQNAESGKVEPMDSKTEPASQTLLDLEASGLTPEDLAAAVRSADEEAEKKNRPVPPAPSAAPPHFHWLILLLFSAACALALAWASEAAGRPETFRLWGLAGLILLLLLMSALPAARLCPRLPTRGGLAAALLSAAFFIQTLDGHPETYFQNCPAALVWAGLLTLVLLWTFAAAIRKLGRRSVAALAGLLLIYAASGPVTALISHFSELTWVALNVSPAFLTGVLPWMAWPMALALGLGLLLAALLSLGDQWSSLRRPGARHGGNFFLALAWLGLMPSGLLLFNPAAEAYPDLVKKVRGLAPVLTGAAPTTVPPVIQRPATAQEQEPVQPVLEPPVAPPAAETPSAPTPVSPAPAPPVPEADPETPRLSELQRRVEDLETRLQLLSDRITQLESPEQPQDLAPLQELEAPADLTAPDRPLPPPPKEESYYSGGSAT